MEQRAVFLDIDGTLTQPGSNEPPDSAVEAIRRARGNGHLVFLCTGRNYDMLKPLLQYDFDGIIASSGGYIVCGEDVIYDAPISDEKRERSMRVLKENGIFRTVECRDGSFTDEEFKEFLKGHATEGSNSELLRWREQVEQSLHILPMRDYGGQPVYKMVIVSRSEEALANARRQLDGDFHFCIQGMDANGFINGELVNPEFDKGKAVARVCSYLELPVERTIAFGDSMNDLELLVVAGTGICMANGSAELKSRADDICPSVEEDGIYRAFEKYHLI